MLTDSQRAAYDRDGFLVLEGLVPREECAALMARANEIVAAFEPATVSVFTTREQTRTSDEYFLESGGEVRCFFEEDAFAPDGTLRQAKGLSINKIGHALHDRDPLFARFSRRAEFRALAHDVGLADPVLLQSMYIFKQPRIGGEVTSHQDATFLYTAPVTVTGLWVALEDATRANGCLWAAPGGHRGPLRRRFVRAAVGGGTEFIELDATPLPTMDTAGAMVPLEVSAGSVVVLHGLLPHQSGANRSERSRHAYSVHVVERGAEYPADNWLQRSAADPARGF